MPQAVSRKQYRMMMAIAHGKSDNGGSRGRPPKSVAAKYTDPGSDAPEQSGEDRGGTWGESHHAKAKEKVKEARRARKKSKKHLHKALEEFYKGQGVGLVVMDPNGNILVGDHDTGTIAGPGGHVDPGESYMEAALRELKEETGLVATNIEELMTKRFNGNDSKIYVVTATSGKLIPSEELKNLRYVSPENMPWGKIRDCCVEPFQRAIATKLGKSLKGMMALEALEKNIIRQKADAVFEMTHGDSLRIVGNGLYRRLNEEVKTMKDEDFKDVHIDTYTVSIRKHMNDVYSGRVSDGHKVVWQWTNKSLPELTAGLMSVFEWYLPEDEHLFEILDESALPDDAIHGGIQSLMDNYRKHNIGNIYSEMETIREQIRNGVAIDVQQVEGRIMKLFDKLETCIINVVDKHNDLAQAAGKEIDELELKLRELQSKLEDVSKKPETVEAFSARPINPNHVHDESYPYLPKPIIEINPNGKIRITFAQEWTSLEKENFLKDVRAKVINKASKSSDSR